MTSALALVVCGAPLAVRAADVAAALAASGWVVRVVGSPASRGWLDIDAIERVTGHRVLFDQRDAPHERGPRPDAVVACPRTMTTAGRVAIGVRFVDQETRVTGAPRPLPSVSGEELAAAFDARGLARLVGFPGP